MHGKDQRPESSTLTIPRMHKMWEGRYSCHVWCATLMETGTITLTITPGESYCKFEFSTVFCNEHYVLWPSVYTIPCCSTTSAPNIRVVLKRRSPTKITEFLSNFREQNRQYFGRQGFRHWRYCHNLRYSRHLYCVLLLYRRGNVQTSKSTAQGQPWKPRIWLRRRSSVR